MPDDLRRTLLFASALQVLGPKHDFTVTMERLLSGSVDETEDDAVDRLPRGEQDVLLDRYQALVSDLPMRASA